MNWIVAKIKWIMLVSGALTFTVIYAALASTFGATLEGPVAEIIVRNWGALIAVVLVYGKASLGHQAGASVAVDSVMVLFFLGYFIATRRGAPPRS